MTACGVILRPSHAWGVVDDHLHAALLKQTFSSTVHKHFQALCTTSKHISCTGPRAEPEEAF
jgi:hypothetical protein